MRARVKPVLYVATTSGFGHEDSFLGVFSTQGKAEKAVDAWYATRVTKRSKNGVAWFRFVSGTKRMSNGREFIDGRPFGANVFFVRPTVVDERWGGFP